MTKVSHNSASDHLRQAMALHRAGRLAEADEQYAAVLGAMPDHPQA